MKKLVLSTIVMAFVVIGCNSNSDNGNSNETTETTTMDNTTMDNTTMDTTSDQEMERPIAEQQFACSMHPEEIGKKDEDCSKCGMKLTVPVKNSENQE